MLYVLSVITPTFGLLLIGYVAARFGLLDGSVGDGLARYVYLLAVPCLLMRTIMHSHVPETQPWGYWLAYFGGALFVWSIVQVIARRIFRRSHREAVIFGFATGHANTALVGIPLILQAVGPEAATPLALLLTVHLPVTTVVATLLFEGTGGDGLRHAGRRIIRMMGTHPILIGIYTGLVLRVAGLDTVGPGDKIIESIAASAAPCALIGMGLELARYGIGKELKPALVISVLKLIVHPAAVYVLARHVFTMPPVWSAVCVLFASCPSGVNAYLMATREKVGVGVASAALTVSTVLSALTISFWLYVIAT
ncbi:AEC family transporter [Mangrovicella endophytica]|uniref:AEC family transporter n=1 Tax=Mangrovicella endophytica TaxID=2066697 RepID=UPI000C9E369E|nr:AEC family transporter [Mangrovicella endophytica]